MLIQILTSPDSLIISKIDGLTSDLHALQQKITIAPWVPFLTAALTGGVLLLGQYLERSKKQKLEKNKDIIETVAKSELLILSLKGLLKELSGNKNLSNFWYYQHEFEENSNDKNKDDSDEYYMRSQAYAAAAIENRSKIYELIAEYYSCISKFKILTEEKFETEYVKELQTTIEFEDAPIIEATISKDVASKLFVENNGALSGKYLLLLKPLDEINNKMTCISQRINNKSK